MNLYKLAAFSLLTLLVACGSGNGDNGDDKGEVGELHELSANFQLCNGTNQSIVATCPHTTSRGCDTFGLLALGPNECAAGTEINYWTGFGAPKDYWWPCAMVDGETNVWSLKSDQTFYCLLRNEDAGQLITGKFEMDGDTMVFWLQPPQSSACKKHLTYYEDVKCNFYVCP